MRQSIIIVGLCLLLSQESTIWGQELQVVDTRPTSRVIRAPRNGAIVVDFDRPVLATSINSNTFWAFGRWSGTVKGTISFSRGRRRVTLKPDAVFSAGESVSVYLSHDIQAIDGSFLRPGGYSFQFWAQARRAPMRFTEVERLPTRSPSDTVGRSYGGIGSDLDGDRFLDLTIVNEDSGDLRIFLNQANGAGTFHGFLEPPIGIGQVPSPSEPGDFNQDGRVDMAVVGLSGVAILLGNGNGTFATPQIVNLGGLARGIAVLDADGDGDMDIASTNHSGQNMAMLFNNGQGVFGPPDFFQGSGPGEYALVTADMNEDGMMDLLVGDRTSESIFVHAGNGDGTYTLRTVRSAGGRVWMMVTGDLNGDGHEDVVTVNSASETSAVLFGDGTGRLGPRQLYATPGFPLATDLGDLDGDGDLDWMVSRFDGNWLLLENDGQGLFTPRETFTARRSGSCALMLDIDNDRDLDLALVDELQDEIIVLKNQAPALN